MVRSGLVAIAVAVVLVAALGSGPAVDVTIDADRGMQPFLSSLTAFPSWDGIISGSGSDVTVSIVVKLLVLAIGVFLLAAVAGRADSTGAAFLAGWGSFVLACAVSAAVFSLVAENLVFDGLRADSEGGALAPLVRDINGGVAFALYTGALVGAAVALTHKAGARAVEPGAPPMIPPVAGTPDAGQPFGPPHGAVPPIGGPPAPVPPGVPNGKPPPPPPMPVATWPPSPNVATPEPPPQVAGTVPPSPAWAPPETQSPLPAAPLPRRGVGSRPVPSLPTDPAESLDSTTQTQAPKEQDDGES